MKHLLILAIILSCLSPAYAQITPFGEIWNNVAYYDTNLEKRGFASLLGRFEGKLGFNLFDSPLQVYGVYYGVSSQSKDYWNNAVYSGAGLRYMPFVKYKASGWQDEWLRGLKIFSESLSASYLKDAASAEAAGLKKSDLRYGLDLWYEWNLDGPIESLPWGELWANFSARSTNFSTLEAASYIFYFQPKIGRHVGNGIEIYLRGDVTYSNRDDSWLNAADYGVGLRIEPWRKTEAADNLLKKFKMFVEVLGFSYLKDKPANPVSSDVRFGIDFSYGR